VLRKSRKEKEEPPTHYPLGTKWERTTRPSPISSTATPASTKAARIGKDGSSGKVETTIPHPASNRRKPASFIPTRPQRPPQRIVARGKMRSWVPTVPAVRHRGCISIIKKLMGRLSSVQLIFFMIPRRRTSWRTFHPYYNGATEGHGRTLRRQPDHRVLGLSVRAFQQCGGLE
jgi:hypothetical protein